MRTESSGSQLRSISVIAYWAGVAMLCIAAPFLLTSFASVLNMHNKRPNEGAGAFIAGMLIFVGGSLLAIFGLSTGCFVWRKRPWTVIYGCLLLGVLLGIFASLATAVLQGWIDVAMVRLS